MFKYSSENCFSVVLSRPSAYSSSVIWSVLSLYNLNRESARVFVLPEMCCIVKLRGYNNRPSYFRFLYG